MRVQAAIFSGDPDTALPVLEGRLASLMSLCDRARAAAGGELGQSVKDAISTIARSLLGNTRWSIPSGWERSHPWPMSWRYGYAAVRAHTFLMEPRVAEVITNRMLEGGTA